MKIGLQVYSVRRAFQANPLGALAEVAKIGYKNLEFANHTADKHPGVGAEISAEKLRVGLENNGQRSIGCHFMPLNEKVLPSILAYHKDLGTASVVMSLDYWRDRADVLDHCKLYNRIGEQCHKAGMSFYYHNHYHEFQTTEGRQVIDLIVENTDPALVSIELDTYWTLRGVVDPVEKIRTYGNRIGILHQKDYPLDQVRYLDVWTKLNRDKLVTAEERAGLKRDEEFTEIGDGIMKVQDIIDAGVDAGVSYMLVEQDAGHCTEFEMVAKSLANLHVMHGLDWEQ
jgi:sugar phosphate isomerase/epimerase